MSMKKMLAVVAAAACVAFAAPAFAANPFSDVPMHHWAYDAVDTLASHGVIQGYPDGTFKGNKPITRYEMSMMVARAMSAGALSGEDSALLKKLMVEFKDELDSLGVRVDNLESRMNAVELGANGWKVNGEIRMTAKWMHENAKKLKADGKKEPKEDGITFDRWRLWMRRAVNENLDLTIRIDAGNFKHAVVNEDGSAAKKETFGLLKVGQFYATAKNFFFGTQARFGLFPVDWEGDDGMYYYDSFVVNDNVFGLELKKVFSAGEFTALLASTNYTNKFEDRSNFLYGLRFKMTPAERFWLSLNGQGNSDWRTLWATLGFKVAEDIELKGSYYWNKASKDADTTNAWKAVLSVGEKKLGFTDLYVEYAHQDKGFYAPNAGDNGELFGDWYGIGRSVEGDVNAWTVAASQTWTDKISTQLHYINATTKVAKGSDIKESTYGANISYKYNPNLKFTLGYDKVNYGKDGKVMDGKLYKDQDVVWFRTSLTF